jgi:purine-binding chemotaxis protein CheW
VKLLTFALDADRYALPTPCVQEVVRALAVAPLPRGPDVVKGLINLRGRVVPVFDVRKRFGRTPLPLHPDHHFVIARAGLRVVALWVDRATDLVEVPDQDVDAAAVPPGAQYVAGVARLPDGLLVIHDLERFLSVEESAQLDGALSVASSPHSPPSPPPSQPAATGATSRRPKGKRR